MDNTLGAACAEELEIDCAAFNPLASLAARTAAARRSSTATTAEAGEEKEQEAEAEADMWETAERPTLAPLLG